VDRRTDTAGITVDLRRPNPNILLITIDDVGVDLFGGVSAYDTWLQAWAGVPPGGVDWAMLPTLQSLADEGVTFTEARSHPNCSPFRAGWMSGRYGFRTGVTTVVRDDHDSPGVFAEFGTSPSDTETIIPKLLTTNGYRTCCVGKWHLGLPDGGVPPNGVPWDGSPAWQVGSGWSHPTDIGWGDFRGTFQNLNKEPQPPSTDGYSPGYSNFFYRDTKADPGDPEIEQKSGVHHTVWTRQQLQNWIKLQPGVEPWMAVWNLSACHAPFGDTVNNGANQSGCAPPASFDPGPGWTDPFIYDTGTVWGSTMASLELIDHQLNELRTNLGSIWDRTVVIVVGDNGSDGTILSDGVSDGHDWGSTYETTVVSGGRTKSTVYEAGLRVPLIIRGPADVVASGGRTSAELVDTVDLYATIRALSSSSDAEAVASGHVFDSYSFRRVLQGASETSDRTFSYSERAEPNGDPDAATLRMDCFTATLASPYTPGRWKLVRNMGSPNELYQLSDGGGSPVDPYETTDVKGTATAEYARLQALLATHLATEP